MFGKKHAVGSVAKIDTLVGAATSVEGVLRFSGGVRVDGEVIGDVLAAEGEGGTLVLSGGAKIVGSVRVSHLVTNGNIVGNVDVAVALEMLSGAKICGDVTYQSIEIHQGAVVEGRLIHRAAPIRELTNDQAD